MAKEEIKFLSLKGLSHFYNKISETFLNKIKGGKITGPLQLTENTHYGKQIPTVAQEGQIYFAEFDGNFPMEINAPSLKENGIPLSQKYQLKTSRAMPKTFSLENKTSEENSLIWENTQNIKDFNVPIMNEKIKNFNFFLIIFRVRGTEQNYITRIINNGLMTEIQYFLKDESYSRKIIINNNQIEIKDSLNYNFTTGKESINNEYLIPYKIYGIF